MTNRHFIKRYLRNSHLTNRHSADIKLADRQIDKQTERQTDRQTPKHRERERERHTHRERQRERERERQREGVPKELCQSINCESTH